MWPLFLAFRPFNQKILVKSINYRVWSPKTKAAQTFINVVIWQKKSISKVHIHMRNVNAVRTVQTQYTTSSATYLRACHHATHKSTALFDDSSVTKFVSQTGTCIVYHPKRRDPSGAFLFLSWTRPTNLGHDVFNFVLKTINMGR